MQAGVVGDCVWGILFIWEAEAAGIPPGNSSSAETTMKQGLVGVTCQSLFSHSDQRPVASSYLACWWPLKPGSSNLSLGQSGSFEIWLQGQALGASVRVPSGMLATLISVPGSCSGLFFFFQS